MRRAGAGRVTPSMRLLEPTPRAWAQSTRAVCCFLPLCPPGPRPGDSSGTPVFHPVQCAECLLHAPAGVGVGVGRRQEAPVAPRGSPCRSHRQSRQRDPAPPAAGHAEKQCGPPPPPPPPPARWGSQERQGVFNDEQHWTARESGLPEPSNSASPRLLLLLLWTTENSALWVPGALPGLRRHSPDHT